jgi:hypothetical protein
MTRQSNTRDPIREAPLRDPGQSLREDIDRAIDDEVLPWFVLSFATAGFAGIEWIRWYFDSDFAPLLVSGIAVVVVILTAARVFAIRNKVKRLKLGLKGERTVGQFLQTSVIPLGYFVLHDIPFDGFNIDHVIIGPGGVFVIEVKSFSKPLRGNATITFDGKAILVAGKVPHRDPIVQVQAGAKSIADILERFTGRSSSVRPVVIFPGWYIESDLRGNDVWVLNAKSFVKFVENERTKLSSEEARVLAEGLSRYVRERISQMV